MAPQAPRTRTEITRLQRSLADEIARAEAQTELEVRADLARYCCMRLTGYLEQALLVMGIEHVRSRASGTPQNFALSFLDKSNNPTTDALLRYVGRFDPEWRVELEALFSQDQTGQDLNALVGIRNQIAHGRNQGISIQRVKEHLANIDRILDSLLDRFAP